VAADSFGGAELRNEKQRKKGESRKRHDVNAMWRQTSTDFKRNMAQGNDALCHVSQDALALNQSNSPCYQQDQQDDNEQAGNAAGSVTPAATMSPSWQGTDQNQYQYDQQDCSDSHDFSL